MGYSSGPEFIGEVVAGRVPDDGPFDAPFALAAEDAAALDIPGYYYGVATGCWLADWPAGFAALAGCVGCLAIPDGFKIPVF